MSDRDTNPRDEDETPAEQAPPPKRAGALRRMLLPAALALGVVTAAAGAYFLGRMSAAGAQTASAAETAPVEAAPVQAKAGKGKPGSLKAAKATKAEKAKAPKRAPLYLALDPAFVVNFQDNESLRFLQIEVQVMAFEQSDLDALVASTPVVRDALVTLFSDQAFESVSTRQGKERLREQALAELRRIVRERTGKDGLEAIYFTSFVMQ